MILITRPQEEALKTQQRLENIGYQCKVFPMLEIVFIKSAFQGLNLNSFDYVIITSQNVVKALIRSKLRFRTPVYVVGQRTENILSDAGFNIAKSFMTVSNLRRFIIQQGHANLLYLSGSVTAWPLSEELQDLGFNISKRVVYESVAAKSLPAGLLHNINIVLFYSPRTAEVFARLCKFDLSKVSSICISEHTANKIKGLGFKSVKIANYPNEKSIFELLK